MYPGTRGARVKRYGFTGDALKVDTLFVKLKFIEEATNSIAGDGLNSG